MITCIQFRHSPMSHWRNKVCVGSFRPFTSEAWLDVAHVCNYSTHYSEWRASSLVELVGPPQTGYYTLSSTVTSIPIIFLGSKKRGAGGGCD